MEGRNKMIVKVNGDLGIDVISKPDFVSKNCLNGMKVVK